MSIEENKALVVHFVETFSSNAWDSVLDMMTDDLRFYTNGSHGFAGLYNGKKSFWEDILKPTWDQDDGGGFKEEITRIVAQGDMVAIESHGYERLKNGCDYNNEYAWLFRIKDGLVADYIGYSDTALVVDTHSVPEHNPRPLAVAHQLVEEGGLLSRSSSDQTQEVATALRLVEAMNAQDAEKVAALLDTAVDSYMIGSTKLSGRLVGKDAVMKGRVLPLLERGIRGGYNETVDRIIAEGPQVVIESRLQQTLGKGQGHFNELIQFFVIEHGAVTGWNTHLDTEALRRCFK